MSSSRFEPGDRVIYTSNRHGKGHNNPLWGSTDMCKGTIDYVDDAHHITVQWDNGSHNSYSDGDLEDAPPDLPAHNPNVVFTRKKTRNKYRKLSATEELDELLDLGASSMRWS